MSVSQAALLRILRFNGQSRLDRAQVATDYLEQMDLVSAV
mgnify:CR=1 FL=1